MFRPENRRLLQTDCDVFSIVSANAQGKSENEINGTVSCVRGENEMEKFWLDMGYRRTSGGCRGDSRLS
jgi:hypothetical protein